MRPIANMNEEDLIAIIDHVQTELSCVLASTGFGNQEKDRLRTLNNYLYETLKMYKPDVY